MLDEAYVEATAADWARRAPHAYEYFRSLVPSLNTRARPLTHRG